LLKSKSAQLALKFSNFATMTLAFWPCLPLLAIKIVLYPSVSFQFAFNNMPLWWIVPTASLFILSFMGVIFIALKSLWEIKALLDCSCDVIVREIEEPNQPVDWDALSNQVDKGCVVAARLMSFSEAGGLVTCLVAQGVVMVPLSTVLTVFQPTGSPPFCIGVASFILCSCIMFGTLLMLADFTSRFKDTAAEANSVLSAARRYPGMPVDLRASRANESSELVDGFLNVNARHERIRLELMKPEEKDAHDRFMKHALIAPLGSEIFGMHISKGFVYSNAARLQSSFPAWSPS